MPFRRVQPGGGSSLSAPAVVPYPPGATIGIPLEACPSVRIHFYLSCPSMNCVFLTNREEDVHFVTQKIILSLPSNRFCIILKILDTTVG